MFFLKKIKSENFFKNDSVVYLFSSLIGFGIPFIQNFLFAALLSEENYGKLVFFISLFGTLSAFFGFGIGALLQRYYYDKKEKQLLQEVFGFWLVCAICLIVVFLIVGKISFSIFYDLPFTFQFYILVVLASALFSINLTFLNIYIVGKKPIKYGLHLILGRLFLFIALIFVYFYFQNDLKSYIIAYTIASSLIFVGTLIEFKINPFTRIRLKTIKEYLKFSYPLMINSVSGIGYSHGYKVLLKLFLSYSELGIFNIASSLANSFYLVSSSLLKGYIPNAFEYLKKNTKKREIPFYRKKILIISLISFLFFIPMSYLFLTYFKNGVYISAIYLLPILLLAQILLLLYGERSLVLLYYKRTPLITTSVLSGSGISVLLLLVLMYCDKGLVLAALPVLIGYGIQFIIATKLSRKI
ncbi:oligosaccharide flippase family protein [Wocania ichthyoenteri]|uniref:oligosaccharide flippase family protein n=1 Tax=Wocania ichthyoenteri TaxID=1230531 RepID=UPI00053F21F9|nr:oligosaccharide flippase family protein [Wocania ichthyoenteri]